MPYSLSKTLITEDTAQKIAARWFGNHCDIRTLQELKDGFFNTAYLLELHSGQKAVLKIAPPASVRVLRYEKDIMRAEVEVMRLVKARLDLPVPEIYGYDPSGRLVDSPYFLMEFIPGLPFNKLRAEMSTEEQRAIETGIGHLTRLMNTITGDSFGYFARTQAGFPTWRGCFDAMLSGILQDGKDLDVALPMPYDDLYSLAVSSYFALDEVEVPRLVHWDLWDGNVFVDPSTRQITGVIDFERAMWGDPLMEFIFFSFQENSAYTSGYGENLLSTAPQKRRRSLYNLYLFLIMVIECYYRKYETHDQENWARLQLSKEIERLQNKD